MPVSCRIDVEAGIVYTTVRGPVTPEEVADEIERIVCMPEFRPGLNGITDVTGPSVEFSFDEVRRLITVFETHRREIGASKNAVVVSKPVVYGIARVFQALSVDTSLDMRVFRDMDQARDWITRSSASSA